MHEISRRRFTAGMGLSAIGAFGLSGCSKVPDTIKIGVAQPLSGPLAALGQDLLNGVNLAVSELNKKGFMVGSQKVTLEVVSADDRSDPAAGRAAAQKLLDAGVVAVIGDLNSGVTLESAPIYAAKNVAQLIISTNPKITQMGLNTTFRIVANDDLQARAMGSFASSQLAAAAYAVIDDGTPYGKGLANGAAGELEKAKKHIAVRQSFDETSVAFTDLAAKIKAEKVGTVIWVLSEAQALAFLQELRKIDYTDVALLGGDMIKTTGMLKGDGVVAGVYATSPVLDVTEFTVGPQFLEKYTAMFKKAPAYGGHYTYDAMYVISQAIQKAQSADPAKITEALHAINGYAPVTGTMQWDAKGEQSYGAVGVYEIRRGAWELRMRSDRW